MAGSGNESVTDGVGTLASFFAPYGIAIDTNGGFFVGNNVGTVQKVSANGRSAATVVLCIHY